MNRKAMKAKAETKAKAWTHPEGTPVTVRKDDGSVVETRTRSMPWVLGETAVILVEGISGGYALERVSPISP